MFAADAPNFVPRIDDIKIAYSFIRELKNASLDSEIEPLPPNLLSQLQNPPQEVLSVQDPDERLSLDLYLATTHASEATYTQACAAVMRRFPECKLLSYHRVKHLIENLSGISPIARDMCVNSCIGYTGPYTSLTHCPHCGQARYEPGHKKLSRKQFTTIPLTPQLQALWRTPEGAMNLQYRRKYTETVLSELQRESGVKVSPYRDFFDGSDCLSAVTEGKIKDDDMVVMLSVDGAQLYRNKASDCWIYIWVVLDHDPSVRYKVRHVLLGGFIPGPNKPKNLDSFMFTGLYHVSAVQRSGGFQIWDAAINRCFTSNIFVALASADGPAMACLNGCVGHHGHVHCRFYCPLVGRHKPGGPHYYPARQKPNNFAVEGCSHPDVDIGQVLSQFTSADAKKAYNRNLRFVVSSRNKTEYLSRRLETGIVNIFSGLHEDCILGVPTMFSGDCMHLPALNIPDLYINLWRSAFDCDSADDKSTWSWAVFRTISVWKAHGKDVVAATPYIPGSFDRPPRNPAEKISSGYKAWEFLLYFYGLGPCLLYNLLPFPYWIQYCKLVRGIRLLIQEEIHTCDILESNQCLTEASDKFETLYVQRRTDRLHFVRASVHAPSHMPHETLRIGPGIIYSQWTMERIIGYLTFDLRLHVNPFSNLAQVLITRSQENALKAMIPDLEPEKPKLPQGAEDIGNGFALRRAQDTVARSVTNAEAEAIRTYLFDHGIQKDDNGTHIDGNYQPLVQRWARVSLPNGQIARSRWKEDLKSINNIRMARNVKIQLAGKTEFVEIHFFISFGVGGNKFNLAVGSFYGPAHQELLCQSSGTYYSVQHFRDVDVRAFDIKNIESVVMMAPDPRYGTVFHDGSEVNRYYLMERPGLKIISKIGWEEQDEEGQV
ncbi:hypothetical protein K435DRAFT_888835 [Dendrothele bispora CBS 962.96]|uniref:Uncharacterized protein n=1 Tax=Dendrothele bispora (strain CBS 962.96) TaxID=1314807 RepID=A0A4S8KR35_DENBC|nr:hypothetical protein K435DRAFT_888835 [Dendrothele bispora CBS 962.96]